MAESGLPAFASPVLSFQTASHDFGKIQEGRTAAHAFVFANEGDTTLVVDVFSLSPGCTWVPSASKMAVRPGETGVIAVQFSTTGRPGKFDGQIEVTSNDPARSPVILGLAADIVPPFFFSPVDNTSIYPDRPVVLRIRANPEYSDPPPKLLNVNVVKAVKNSMHLSSMDKPDWKVTLVLGASRGPSPCDGRVELTTNIPYLPLYMWNCHLLGDRER